MVYRIVCYTISLLAIVFILARPALIPIISPYVCNCALSILSQDPPSLSFTVSFLRIHLWKRINSEKMRNFMTCWKSVGRGGNMIQFWETESPEALTCQCRQVVFNLCGFEEGQPMFCNWHCANLKLLKNAGGYMGVIWGFPRFHLRNKGCHRVVSDTILERGRGTPTWHPRPIHLFPNPDADIRGGELPNPFTWWKWSWPVLLVYAGVLHCTI